MVVKVISIATLGVLTVGSMIGGGCWGLLEGLPLLTNTLLLLPSPLLTGEGVDAFLWLKLMCVVYV